MTEYTNIGFTQKTHGVGGELKIAIEDQYWEDFFANERLFIDVKGVKVPYFIENVRGEGVVIVKFEDVDSKEAAFGLQSRQVFLRSSDLIPPDQRNISLIPEISPFEALQGYNIIDETVGPVGLIEAVIDMAMQQLAVVPYRNREIFIPLNDALIQRIDHEGKLVYMLLPEGLLEL